jgi:LmbE family N-acetylglucosaminyl deacetylase
VTSSRVIAEAQTPETSWATWLDSLGIAARAAPPAWLPAHGRLVVVAPHPDDELLACGGLLSMHAERGGECLLLAVTDGEASHRGTRGWSAARLGALRRLERAVGLERLGFVSGLVAVQRLGLPDGQVCTHFQRLAEALRRCLRPGDVVVTTWRLDGHPDHEATGLAALRAGAALGCRVVQAPVWMWHWARPGDAQVPWQRLQCIALTPEVQARKQAALSAHRSQLCARSPVLGPVLDASILARSRRAVEHYFV